MKLLQKTEVPEQEMNGWVIKKFTVNKEKADHFNMMQIFSGSGFQRSVTPGEYTKLGKSPGSLWMSDTPAEIRDHYEPAHHAKDHCLIGGLGLGIIVEACLRKPEVSFVTVIEIEEDIIKMVGDYLYDKWGRDRLEIIHADLFEWRPPKGQRYGMAWFDVWPTICQDNWDEMKLLQRRYGSKADWKGSWGRNEIMQMNRQDREDRTRRWGYW